MDKASLIRKYVILALVLSRVVLYAQSSWTGHAAVAQTSEFVGKTGSKRAFSNSFPEGAVLQITNPQNGLSVEVNVVGSLKAPGLFLIIEENAAREIGLPNDHVVTVKAVQIYSKEKKVNLQDYSLINPISSSDPDYNLKLSIRKAGRKEAVQDSPGSLPPDVSDEDRKIDTPSVFHVPESLFSDRVVPSIPLTDSLAISPLPPPVPSPDATDKSDLMALDGIPSVPLTDSLLISPLPPPVPSPDVIDKSDLMALDGIPSVPLTDSRPISPLPPPVPSPDVIDKSDLMALDGIPSVPLTDSLPISPLPPPVPSPDVTDESDLMALDGIPSVPLTDSLPISPLPPEVTDESDLIALDGIPSVPLTDSRPISPLPPPVPSPDVTDESDLMALDGIPSVPLTDSLPISPLPPSVPSPDVTDESDLLALGSIPSVPLTDSQPISPLPPPVPSPDVTDESDLMALDSIPSVPLTDSQPISPLPPEVTDESDLLALGSIPSVPLTDSQPISPLPPDVTDESDLMGLDGIPSVPLIESVGAVPLVPSVPFILDGKESESVTSVEDVVDSVPPEPENEPEILTGIETAPVQIEDSVTPEVIVTYDLSDIDYSKKKEPNEKVQTESVAEVRLRPETEIITELDIPLVTEPDTSSEVIDRLFEVESDSKPVESEPKPEDPAKANIEPPSESPEPDSKASRSKLISRPDPIAPSAPEVEAKPNSGTIYFLQPSDMRPPPSSQVSSSEKIDDVMPASSGNLNDIPRIKSGDKKTYVQIASITSLEQLAEVREKANTEIADYPLAVLANEKSGKTIYKLLVGPLQPAEIGATLKVVRTSSFPGAFKFVN